jgi:hypothetical protein
VLPPSLAEAMKPMAKQNILLNLGISLLPGIDAAAHLGGGLTGALVLASGLLYPRTDQPSRDSKRFKPTPAPAWISGLAVASVLLLAYGVLTALFEGQPWDPEVVRRLHEVLVAGD